MQIKKLLSFLKSKGIEPTADEISDFADEPKAKDTTPISNVPDYSQIQHNVKIIKDLESRLDSSEKEKNELTKLVSELKTAQDNFIQESLKREEERAAAEKAYKEKIELETKEKNAKLIEDRIALLVQETKIEPKNEELINKLKGMDLETIEVFAKNLTPTATQTNGNTNNTNGQQNRPNPTVKLGKGATIDEYLSDLVIN